MSEWKKATLGELVALGKGRIQTGPFGSQLHAHDYVEVGIPCLMPVNLKDNKIDITNVSFISDADAKRLAKHLVKSGDVIYSRRGDVTQKAIITEKEAGYFCGTGCLLVRVGNSIDSNFLVYFLSTSQSKNWILNNAVGITMPNLNTKILSKFPIAFPDLNVQKQIAKVLSNLDSKISLNNRINKELETMAKLIYDYWFVQFDFPISAAQAASVGKPMLAGKPYKSSGGKMVYNTELKREIPEGWDVKNLVEEMDVQYGFPFSTRLFNEEEKGVPVVRIRDIINNSISLYSTENINDKYQLREGDLLIGMDGNFHMNYWDKEGCYLNQRSLRIRRASHSRLSQMQAFFDVEPYIKLREKSVSRTTVGHLSARDVNSLKVLVPSADVSKAGIEKFDVFLKMIINNRKQNQKLSELRDWLLPMLMNGQVTISSSDKSPADKKEAEGYLEKEADISMAAEGRGEYG